MPNWKSLEAKDRLLAAVVAANPDKKLLDYRRIATYYGMGATYDSIEGQFRVIRKEAAKLREAVESGEHTPAPKRGSHGQPLTDLTVTGAKAPKTPRANRKKDAGGILGGSGGGSNLLADNGVISGRITKTNGTPSRRARQIKLENNGAADDVVVTGSVPGHMSSPSRPNIHQPIQQQQQQQQQLRQRVGASPSPVLFLDSNPVANDENGLQPIKIEDGPGKPANGDLGDFSFGEGTFGDLVGPMPTDATVDPNRSSFNTSFNLTSSGEWNVMGGDN